MLRGASCRRAGCRVTASRSRRHFRTFSEGARAGARAVYRIVAVSDNAAARCLHQAARQSRPTRSDSDEPHGRARQSDVHGSSSARVDRLVTGLGRPHGHPYPIEPIDSLHFQSSRMPFPAAEPCLAAVLLAGGELRTRSEASAALDRMLGSTASVCFGRYRCFMRSVVDPAGTLRVRSACASGRAAVLVLRVVPMYGLVSLFSIR